jgi:hypothetical protein
MPKESAHPQVSVRIMQPTCAGLTHTSDANSTLDGCQQAGNNIFRGQYKLLSTFYPTGAHLGGAQTQKNCVLL